MDQSTKDTATPAPNQGVGIGYLSLVVVIFVLGIVIGFLGRPAVVGDTYVEVVVTATPDPDVEAVAESDAATSSANTSDAEEKENATPPTPTIMDFVLADARHFQGNADAPVTIVEFSDFK